MKSIVKLLIVGVMGALIFYACSPRNDSGKSALLKLEKRLSQNVETTEISALGYSVKVGDSYSEYYKVKCEAAELDRLVKVLDLESSYPGFTLGPNAPDWLNRMN